MPTPWNEWKKMNLKARNISFKSHKYIDYVCGDNFLSRIGGKGNNIQWKCSK